LTIRFQTQMGKIMRNVFKQLVCIAALACLLLSVAVQADSKKGKGKGLTVQADLSGAQEVGSVGPGLIESARITANFEKDLSAVKVRLRINGGGNVVAAHFHCGRAGENGPVAVTLISSSPGPVMFDGTDASGTLTNADVVPGVCGGRPLNNIASLAFAMRDGLIYTNVHTSDNPPGEVRGQMFE
jgi:hypothetical protein